MYLMGGETGYCISKACVVFPTGPRLSQRHEEAKSGRPVLVLSPSLPRQPRRGSHCFPLRWPVCSPQPCSLGLVALPKLWACSPEKAPPLPWTRWESHHLPRGACAPKPSFVCSSFLNQSVNLHGLRIVLFIHVNVNVDQVCIYSNFYFIFSGRWGGGVGNVPLITPRAAAGAGAPTARPPRGAAPWGRPRCHIPALSGIGTSQCSSYDRLSGPACGVLSLSCWVSFGKPLAGPVRIQIQERTAFLCWGHSRRRAACLS